MRFVLEALIPIFLLAGVGFGVWRGARATARALHARKQTVELEEARWEPRTVTGQFTNHPAVPAILVQIEKRGHRPVEIARVPSTTDDVEDKLMEAQARAASLAKTMNGE